MFDEKWFHCIHAGSAFSPFVTGVRLRNILLVEVAWSDAFVQLNPFFCGGAAKNNFTPIYFQSTDFFTQIVILSLTYDIFNTSE